MRARRGVIGTKHPVFVQTVRPNLYEKVDLLVFLRNNTKTDERLMDFRTDNEASRRVLGTARGFALRKPEAHAFLVDTKQPWKRRNARSARSRAFFILSNLIGARQGGCAPLRTKAGADRAPPARRPHRASPVQTALRRQHLAGVSPGAGFKPRG